MYSLIPLVTLLPSIIVSLPLDFANARDFYHELGSAAMQLLFNSISLDITVVEILSRLVSDDRYNIQKPYNKACSSMGYDRAKEILHLSKNRKDLEILLLGPACLSTDIIKARKAIPQMWPPSGFPFIIDQFKSKNVPAADITDILDQSLNRPESWQSAKWTEHVEWETLDDSRFWRMTLVDYYIPDALPPYIINSVGGTTNQANQDLEELLMKSIRIICFDVNWSRALKKKLDDAGLLETFSHLQDEWSLNVHALLKSMHSKDWNSGYFPEALLNSKLLQFIYWQNNYIDATTATNDIFELFITAFRFASTVNQHEIKQAFTSFLKDIPDWSSVRPVVLKSAIIDSHYYKFLDYASFGKYYDHMLSNPNASAVLPYELHRQNSKSLKVYRYNLKKSTDSLKDQFASKDQDQQIVLSPYTGLIYKIWKSEEANWPGVVAVHEKIKGNARRVFKDNPYEPKTDQEYTYHAWLLAFDSIKFAIQHGIPNNVIPSRCFLQALLYYHKKRSINWTKLKRKADKECIFPEQQSRYRRALRAAHSVFIVNDPSLPTTSVELLQELLRGDEIGKELVNELTRGIINLDLN